MKKKVLSHLLAVALVILVSGFMPLFLFFTNIEAIKFVEVAIFIGVFSAIGLILFTILRLTTKSEYKAAAITAVVTLIYQNIGRLQPLIGPWFVVLLFAAIVVGLVFLVKKVLTEEIARIFTPVMTIMLTMLCLLNTVTSIGKISSVANVKSEVKAELDEHYEYLSSCKTEEVTTDRLPNVYLFIPDEYAGFRSAEEFLGYDNKEFKDFLLSNNFQISESSTNYKNGTLECLADVFNLELNEKNDYDVTDEAYCQAKVSNSLLFQMAEETGYSVRAFQPIDLIDYESETSQYGKMWSTTAEGDLTIDLMLEPTIIYPIKDAFLSVLDLFSGSTDVGSGVVRNLADANSAPLSYFTSEDAEYRENTFNLCYALLPHQPFVYDAEGNFVGTADHLADFSTPDAYLEQYKYSTKLLTQSIENILENDPDSIIILMSDHGLRKHDEDKNTWMQKMDPEDNADILCAVYYKGEEFESIEGLCGTNVMINVVNKAFGYEIPYIGQSEDLYFD